MKTDCIEWHIFGGKIIVCVEQIVSRPGDPLPGNIEFSGHKRLSLPAGLAIQRKQEYDFRD